MTTDASRIAAMLQTAAERHVNGFCDHSETICGDCNDDTAKLLLEAASAIARLQSEHTDKEADRASWRRVAERLQSELDSERDRRTSAQEAITGHWQPLIARLQAERDEADEDAKVARGVLKKLMDALGLHGAFTEYQIVSRGEQFRAAEAARDEAQRERDELKKETGR